MPEPAGTQGVKRPLPCMPVRRVPYVMPERDRLRKVLIQSQGLGYRSRIL